MSKKGECAHCGSKKIKKVDTVFTLDVNHDVYECEKCKELTIHHLYWEKFSKSERKNLKKGKTR